MTDRVTGLSPVASLCMSARTEYRFDSEVGPAEESLDSARGCLGISTKNDEGSRCFPTVAARRVKVRIGWELTILMVWKEGK